MGIPGMSLDVVAWVVGGLVALAVFFAVVFGGTLWFLGRMARQKEASASQRYPHALIIDRTASFFGQESRGATQMRGNGTLILTDSELIFEMWVPSSTFRIPLQAIQRIENPTSFLGKTRFGPLLKVLYATEDASNDAMAWQVRDLDGWVGRINEARG
jgi:hypothetical protein